MIALLLAMQRQQEPVHVLELIEPTSPYVVVQAYIKAPANMNERQVAAWNVLGRVLLEGTIEYTPQKLREYGSQAGVPPTVTVMPDFMRLQVVLPKAGLALAGDLVFSILTRPALREEDVAKAATAIATEQSPPWIALMSGAQVNPQSLRSGDVRALWVRAVRKENLNFVVGGGMTAGSGTAEIQTRFANWTPERMGTSFGNSSRPNVTFPEPVSTFSLAAPAMTPASVASAPKLLAVFALGIGQGSSMFRVLREGQGMSYLQSAVLWPTQQGWRPYFLLVRRTEAEEGKYATQMKDLLLKDAEAWTETDLKRAQAMADAAFTRDFAFSPIWLGPNGPMSQSLADRCAWRGYLEMVGSGALREDVLVRALQNVDLDQLKAAAKSLLDECNVGWLPGRP